MNSMEHKNELKRTNDMRSPDDNSDEFSNKSKRIKLTNSTNVANGMKRRQSNEMVIFIHIFLKKYILLLNLHH